MRISIAMATYNGAQYIQEQLQSFVEQTRWPDELIITDDCSTDNTEAIVLDFAKVAPFTVKFYRNVQNLGYCGNFNAALMKTTGDLVFLSDQDDVWFPEKIEHMVNVAARNPKALILMNDAALTDEHLNEIGLTKVGQICSAGFSMNSFVMGCCCVVRRELLNFCLPIPSKFQAHDSWLVRFALGLGARVFEPTVLQYYRRHAANESQFIANRTKKMTRMNAFLCLIRNRLKCNAAARIRNHLEQDNIFLDGVARAKKSIPRRYMDLLNALEQHYRIRVIVSQSRLTVIEKPFFPRIIGVGYLFLRGTYGNANGLRSAVSDILG